MKRVAKLSNRVPRWYVLGVLVSATMVAGILATGRTWAEPKSPPANSRPNAAYERQIAQVVTRYLHDEHLSRHPLNDEISQRTFDTFLKMLDPMKVYFLQSDVDEFSKLRNDLDDKIQRGDVSFAYTVFDRFLQRIDQRVALVDELLKQEHDFTVDEEMMTDPKTTTYAKSDAELRDKWRKRIKYDLLVKKADKADKAEGSKRAAQGKNANGAIPKVEIELQTKPDAQVKESTPAEKISRRYHSFAKRMHQSTGEELLERYLTALTTSYDPHTSYMSPSNHRNFQINMNLRLEGIGAALEYQLEEGFTKVSRLIPGGPAEKDGRLKPEDQVIGVGQGVGGEIVDVVDMSLNEVVERIRGPAGTVVRMKVQPTVGGESKLIDITRASIELKDQEARAEIIEVGGDLLGSESKARKRDGKPYKVGVIDLPSFYMDMEGARLGLGDYKSTTRDMQKILQNFNAKGVDAVVLDLRRNGGGSLQEAVSLTGLFIDEGPIVQVKEADGRVQQHLDLDKGVAWAGPLVVLESKFSASASEIFAGAIQDYNRGIVIGDHTSHGKGTVQNLSDVARRFFPGIPNAPQLGALKITIQQFYRPNGDSTQNRGVVSDVELPSITTHFDVGEADLDYALKFDRIEPAPFTKANLVDKSLLDELRNRSTSRVQQSEDFQKAAKKIAHYLQFKQRKTVPLNEQKYLAERAELNTEQEEEDQFKQLDDPNRPVIKRDYYFNEILAVTLDYLQLNHKVASVQGVAGGNRRTLDEPRSVIRDQQ